MMTKTIPSLGILLFNARRDLERRESDVWGALVWDHATALYERHGSALLDALRGELVAPESRDAARRLADSLAAYDEAARA